MKSIEDKIRDLLRRTTENGATESEAEQAIGYAQKLMERHNIELAQVLKEEQRELDLDDITDEVVQSKSTMEVFERDIATCVCSICGVKWYYQKKWVPNVKYEKLLDKYYEKPTSKRGKYPEAQVMKVNIHFYGLAQDVAAARILYCDLVVITRALARHSVGKRWTQRHWHYCRGFAEGLRLKAWELAAEARQVRSSDCTVLITTKNNLVQRFAEERLRLRSGRASKRKLNSELFAKGVADGKQYDLAKPSAGYGVTQKQKRLQ